MTVKRETRASSLIDVIDRVLDKGIVLDAAVCVSLLGIDHIVDIDARVVVASIDTYLRYAGPISSVRSVARPVRMQAGPASVAPRTPDRSVIRFSSTDPIRARGLGVRLDYPDRVLRPVPRHD